MSITISLDGSRVSSRSTGGRNQAPDAMGYEGGRASRSRYVDTSNSVGSLQVFPYLFQVPMARLTRAGFLWDYATVTRSVFGIVYSRQVIIASSKISDQSNIIKTIKTIKTMCGARRLFVRQLRT
jgi:hypothetical protein